MDGIDVWEVSCIPVAAACPWSCPCRIESGAAGCISEVGVAIAGAAVAAIELIAVAAAVIAGARHLPMLHIHGCPFCRERVIAWCMLV